MARRLKKHATVTERAVVALTRVRAQILRAPRSYDQCGTAQCIGGKLATILSVGGLGYPFWTVRNQVEHALGLNTGKLINLCTGTPDMIWPYEFREAWVAARTPYERAHIAANRGNDHDAHLLEDADLGLQGRRQGAPQGAEGDLAES